MGLFEQWNKNKFSVYTSDEKTTLRLMEQISKWLDTTIKKVDEIDTITNDNKNKKVSYEDMYKLYKMTLEKDNVNYNGKWHGLDKPTLSDEGMRATVEKLDKETKGILNKFCYSYNGVVPSIPTNHLLVYQMYDELVSKYPTNVSQTVLGTDSLGNEIKAYTFTNPLVTNNNGDRVDRGTILITTCIHGDERSTSTQLYCFLKELVESEPPSLLYDFKAKYRIKVIPISNPSGYDSDTRQNSNKVDIARNFNANWVLKGSVGDYEYSGVSAASEKETKVIQDYINLNIQSELLIDIHNTAQGSDEYMPQRYNQFTWINTPTKDTYYMKELREPYQNAIFNCSKLWSDRHKELDKNIIFGMYDNFNLANVTEYGMINRIKSVQLEIPWKISKLDSEKFQEKTVRIGIEMIGNMLINYYKQMKLINEDESYIKVTSANNQTLNNGEVTLVSFDTVEDKTNNISLSYSGVVVPKGYKKARVTLTTIFDKSLNGIFENRVYIAQDKGDRIGVNSLYDKDTRAISGSNSIDRFITSSFTISDLKANNVLYFKTLQLSGATGDMKGGKVSVYFE